MIRRLLPLAVVLLLGTGPAACGPKGAPGPKQRLAPTWLALGGEAYRYDEALDAQGDPLDVVREPRWFGGLAAPPPEPVHLHDVPLTDRGARLELEVHWSEDGGSLKLVLTLHAAARPLWRETEHRWTNITPFLFGFYADGKPVQIQLEGAGKFGGIERFVELVPRTGKRAWTLTLTRSSIEPLLPEAGTSEISIVAAFSERQHSPFALMELRGYETLEPQVPEPPFADRPVLLRSPLRALRW